ncbi:TIGR04024 family LLM class F420-dependent oxidoreductase [Halobacteriales archaeon QS_3_64_16]|nr:MAG: TIGR04024 family LLM class F420-dependent oxidoreductase [Halobacteriales archaeon QS_3_64_16]
MSHDSTEEGAADARATGFDADREIHLPVAAQESVGAIVEIAQRAERAGYERAWMPETWGRDAITVLASIAHGTSEIGLGTSIAPVYSRSPTLVGQTAATLQEVSEGRFRLGLGPSGPAVIENWHGVEFGNPLRRTREYVDITRQVLAGERVTYDGEYFELEGFRLRSDPPERPPEIDVTGMGPKAVELAGRFADGWHAILLTHDGFDERIADLRRGVELGNRDPADVRSTWALTCCALEDGERARRLVRGHLAFYVGAMGDYYRESLARQGHAETAEAITEHWQSGEREAAVAAISDELLDDLAVAGTPDRARKLLSEFGAIEGVDALAVSFPREAGSEEIEATIDALAPET